jgi:hypothetical protein
MLLSSCSFSALHHRGRFRKMFINTSWTSTPPGFYYPYDFEDNELHEYSVNEEDDDDDNQTDYNYDYTSLGLGDFLAFNLMSLMIMNPLWSTITKMCVFFGCIVSIHIGHGIIIIVQSYWQENGMPAVPFATISFSAYAIVLNIIMHYTSVENIDMMTCI